MRMKCIAEESIGLEHEADALIKMVADERVLILSTEEEAFLTQQNIDNDTYYDAKKSLLFDGETSLYNKLKVLDLGDDRCKLLFDFMIKRN